MNAQSPKVVVADSKLKAIFDSVEGTTAFYLMWVAGGAPAHILDDQEHPNSYARFQGEQDGTHLYIRRDRLDAEMVRFVGFTLPSYRSALVSVTG